MAEGGTEDSGLLAPEEMQIHDRDSTSQLKLRVAVNRYTVNTASVTVGITKLSERNC